MGSTRRHGLPHGWQGLQRPAGSHHGPLKHSNLPASRCKRRRTMQTVCAAGLGSAPLLAARPAGRRASRPACSRRLVTRAVAEPQPAAVPFLSSADHLEKWSSTSWRNFPALQQPAYPDQVRPGSTVQRRRRRCLQARAWAAGSRHVWRVYCRHSDLVMQHRSGFDSAAAAAVPLQQPCCTGGGF